MSCKKLAIHDVIETQKLDCFEKIKAFFTAAPYNLRVVDDAKRGLYLMRYDHVHTDFSFPACQEARGIILEKGTNKIVCYPFNKFFNAGEKFAAQIDWANARVQRKYDGSIIKIYWLANEKTGKDGGEWMIATNGTIDARNATVTASSAEEEGEEEEEKGGKEQDDDNDAEKEKRTSGCGGKIATFLDLFNDAMKYTPIDFSLLKKECTYMFELMHPKQLIVVHYAEPKLVHIGTRNNISFEENNDFIGVQQAHRYSLSSLQECVDAATKLDSSEEGFVVVDQSFRRIKIKGAVYVMLHHTLTDHSLTEEELAAKTVLRGEQGEIGSFEKEKRFEGICKQIVSVTNRLNAFVSTLCDYWESLLQKGCKSRKEVAMACKKDAGDNFNLYMARCTYEEKEKDAEKREEAFSFFKRIVLEKYGGEKLTVTEIRTFLAVIKSKKAQ